MIDLHMHTKYSDGTDDIIEFLDKAEKNQISVLSITDHNTVKAYDQLEKIKIKDYFSGKIISGIELNTKILNIPIEILGYGIDYHLMDSLLPHIYLTAEERNKIEFKRLYQKCLNAGISFNESLLSNYDCSCFASTFIHYLITQDLKNQKIIDKDAWNNSSIFYRKYMSNPHSILYVEMDDLVPDFETAANLIRKCGGIVSIPHIFEYRENAEKILNYILNNHQIDAIECYYTTFTLEQTAKLLNICKERKLLVSGGSDYHGEKKPNVLMGKGLGNLCVPSDVSILNHPKIDFLC